MCADLCVWLPLHVGISEISNVSLLSEPLYTHYHPAISHPPQPVPTAPGSPCFGGNAGMVCPEVSLPAHVTEFSGLRSLQRTDTSTC